MEKSIENFLPELVNYLEFIFEKEKKGYKVDGVSFSNYGGGLLCVMKEGSSKNPFWLDLKFVEENHEKTNEEVLKIIYIFFE